MISGQTFVLGGLFKDQKLIMHEIMRRFTCENLLKCGLIMSDNIWIYNHGKEQNHKGADGRVESDRTYGLRDMKAGRPSLEFQPRGTRN